MGRYLLAKGDRFLRTLSGTWTRTRAEAFVFDDERMQESFDAPQARPGWTLAAEHAERFGATVVSVIGKREPGRRSGRVAAESKEAPFTMADLDAWIFRRLARERSKKQARGADAKPKAQPLPNLGPTAVRPWSDLHRELAKLDEAEGIKRRGR